MKRQAIFGIVALATLTMGLSVFGQDNGPVRRPRPAQEPAAPRQEMSAELQIQRLQQQIDDLRTSHQELVDELNLLRETAVKEKATETAGGIEKLIGKQREDLQNKVRQLQRQQQALRQLVRDESGTTGRPTRQPRKAPEFELKTFDGKTVKLSDYKGKIVVLEWINLDCPFSMYHHKTKSTMVDLANKYKNKGVVWLAINSTALTTPKANLDFIKSQKLPYPILDDRSGRVGRLYGARTTPQMIVIDKDGVIAYDGAIDSAPMGEVKEGLNVVNYVDVALAALTSGKKVALPVTVPYGCSVKYATP